MRIPIHIAQRLLELSQGESIPSSKAKHSLIDKLVSENIITRTGRLHKKLILSNPKALNLYLQNKYGINDLEKYIEVIQQQQINRSELVKVSSNSKLKTVRTFQGFLINSYVPIQANLNEEPITLEFSDGIFQFMYDFEKFIPEATVTIIGIENPENFRWIAKQKHLFNDIKPLFVSRYPQNQSKDLIKWLQSIPNDYLHFGDFDFAGIGIYMNEFKKHLSEKANFFIPEHIESMISKNGNTARYNQQKINFKATEINDERLLQLIEIIHKYKKGLDQEVFIQDNEKKRKFNCSHLL